MQRYIFVDLDDTLFQTLRKCAAEEQNLAPRAYLHDERANSFATEKQQWLWNWLDAGFRIIPVTGRDFPGFARVSLPFHEEIVLNHGAVILDKQRQVDSGWMAQMQAVLPDYLSKLMPLWAQIEAFANQSIGYKVRLVEDFDMTWYGVVKHADGTEARLKKLLDVIILNHPSIRDSSLYWHLNGNNLAVLPKIINKESAVQYLLARYQQQYGNILSFGAGDSNSDAPFLALCDYALLPKNTQLFNATLKQPRQY